MRALVIGGAGFIGEFLCKKLYKHGWEIRIFDIKEKMNPRSELEYIAGDILDYHKVFETMKDVDLIIHLAAKHRFFGVSRDEFYRVNVEGTKTILEAASERRIKNIIFYSSVATYGDQTSATDEHTIPQPNNPYGTSKLAAEKLISDWFFASSSDRNALIIRPTVVFGPKNKGNMYRLIRQIDRGLYIPVGAGKNIKSIAYVENIVDATIFLIEKGLKGMEIYNYVDEPAISSREIVNNIYRLLGRPIPKLSLSLKPILFALRPFDFIAKVTKIGFPIRAAIIKLNKPTHHSANKIRRRGFQQRCSLEEGLRRTIKWYKN